MNNIKNYNLEDLKQEMISIGEKPYRAEQIFKWIYIDKVKSFEEMTNLSLELRKKLEEVGVKGAIETRRGLGYIMP